MSTKISLDNGNKIIELFKEENFLDEIINLDASNDGISGFLKLSKEIKKR